MTFISYAQNFEDVLLWRALRHIERGRYVDIGAQDPVVDSVSLAFYNAGWSGIHVDPVPTYAAKLREARPDETVIEAAVTDAEGPIEFYELGGLSSGRQDIAQRHARSGACSRKILVSTVRLDHILALAGPETHWLKIDVEGMEADVLRSWGESACRPWILAIESTFPNTQEPTHHLWLEEVLRRGYHQVFFDGLSCYFVHDDHREIDARFAAPANVFDRFSVTSNHFVAADVRRQLEDSERELRQENSRAEQVAAELGETRQAYEAARQGQCDALQTLATAQQEHRAAIDTLSWEHRDSERRLREQAGEAEAAAAAARVEIARLDERCIQLQDKLDRTDQQLASVQTVNEQTAARVQQEHETFRLRIMQLTEERDRARVQLDQSWAETDRMSLDFEEQLEKLRARLAQADSLIGQAAAEKPGLWYRIGETLGVARPQAALQMLRTWRTPEFEASQDKTLSQQDSVEGKIDRMPSLAPRRARNPYLRANSLAELLTWHDLDFIRCAYVTVLGRQPDRQGESYYIDRIRRGYSKMEVLWQLRHCAEAADHDPGIAGFDRALKRARIFGRPIRALWRSFTGGRPGVRLHEVGWSDEGAGYEPEADGSKVNESGQHIARVDALAAEIETLKSIMDGLGHALRGVTNAQARYEAQLNANSSSIGSSSVSKATSRGTSPARVRSDAPKSSLPSDLIETVR